MPTSSLNKKIKPAKRAWKSFTNMLKSRFHDLHISDSIRDSTSQFLGFLFRGFLVPFRTRFLRNSSKSHSYTYKKTNRSSRLLGFLSCLKHSRYKYNSGRKKYEQIGGHRYDIRRGVDFSAVYVDKIYEERGRWIKEGIMAQKEGKEEDHHQELEFSGDVDTIEEAWRAVVAASPHLRVDERAEEFISKFREEIRIEKERSFLEFEERLKRSV